jgi:multicomponent Na+:H+ antiporter subunit E
VNDLKRKDNPAVRALLLFGVTFFLWMLLVGSLALQEVGAGLLVALLVTIISFKRAAMLDGLIVRPDALIHMATYLGYFLFSLVRANLDMARRIISPSLPINPSLIEVQTSLQSDLGKMLLANSITLTPGTLTVRVQKQNLLVHWIDSPKDRDLDQETRSIAEGFERRIRGFLK